MGNNLARELYFDNYSPVGDIMVLAICGIILILVFTTYVNNTRSFKVFLSMIFYLAVAAICDIVHHRLYLNITDGVYTSVYVFRVLYHAALFSILLLYVVYIVTLQHLEHHIRVPVMVVSASIYAIVVISDIVTTVRGTGFKINKNGVSSGWNIFLYGYLAFMVVIVYLMIRYRDRLYKRVMNGFYGTMIVAFLVLSNQGRHGQSSFTVSTFLLPIIAMLFLIHATPYDVELGAVSVKSLNSMVRHSYERKSTLIFMSLYLPEYDLEGKKMPANLQKVIRDFSSMYFRGAVLFQITNGHMILMAKKSSNPDHENKINKIINSFNEEYEKFKLDYKVVIGETIDEISRRSEYVSFISNIYRNMPLNTIHIVDYEDVEAFNKHEYIVEELGDIYRRKDMRDTRVLAYCQPVYNIKTGKYDTAEALMRLKLPNVGLVFPDQFIPLAEELGYIHVLTEIILQKTCDEIRYLLNEGYEVKRISVNVSVPEMREKNFIKDIETIIDGSGIPEEKVAIEITESQTESDFLIMKRTIDQLKDKGVKFYLDDFGTGYSNMERIMELPFDIIKFDRSLVLASDTDERSAKMVQSLANMFDKLDYSVLYEGVENDSDEKRCMNMSASYLQGYKYSRPIPIIELKNFFSKANVEE